MARDWIKWVKGLSRRREVVMLARTLGISRREAACACMEMWEWADGETLDGNIKGATGGDIDELLGLPGFAVALQAPEVGWLVVRANGITFPRYERNNGETAKRRAVEAHKKSRQRDLRQASASRSRPAKCPEDVPPRRRPEKRREELKLPSPIPPSAPVNPSAPDPEPLSAEWMGVAEILRECGVVQPEIACEIARHRASARDARNLIDSWRAKPGAWSVGLLVSKVKTIQPDTRPNWPQPSADYERQQHEDAVAERVAERQRGLEKQIREREERRAQAAAAKADREALPNDPLAELAGRIHAAANPPPVADAT